MEDESGAPNTYLIAKECKRVFGSRTRWDETEPSSFLQMGWSHFL
jgi:hypothetical protein